MDEFDRLALKSLLPPIRQHRLDMGIHILAGQCTFTDIERLPDNVVNTCCSQVSTSAPKKADFGRESVGKDLKDADVREEREEGNVGAAFGLVGAAVIEGERGERGEGGEGGEGGGGGLRARAVGGGEGAGRVH